MITPSFAGITYGGCELLGPVIVPPAAIAAAVMMPHASSTPANVFFRILFPPLVDGRSLGLRTVSMGYRKVKIW
ncbi:MAG: hypothetical protein H0T13_01690 [Actinobacteria bacterium]|nr:hypothetical protein [Actinomycetota bacterium]